MQQWFQGGKVDIAILRLNAGESVFSEWLDVIRLPICIQQDISVLSLVVGLGGQLDFASQNSTIYMIDSDTCLCRAQYYAEDGSSGSAIVAHVLPGSTVGVVGVHSASHDSTVAAPAIKKQKTGAADADSVKSSHDSLSQSIHGHSAFSLICIANKTQGVLDLIDADIAGNP